MPDSDTTTRDKELPVGASGLAHENPAPGGVPDRNAELDFDDGTDMAHPRGNDQRTSGTWAAQGGDSAPLGPPAEVRSGSLGPDDPENDRGGR